MAGCLSGYFLLADLYEITVRNEADVPLTEIQLESRRLAQLPEVAPGNSARHWVRVLGETGIHFRARSGEQPVEAQLENYVVGGQAGRPVTVTVTADRAVRVQYRFGGAPPQRPREAAPN